ncbi:MAG: sigma-70 family RNA polymerase sigma factor, partial [Solirubrobacteraceae bacterium]|nr:sigma-70 family RNA polymerase sigma factor [Solirubrobacteraceae bacterium]
MRPVVDPRASFDAFYRANARGVMAFCASRGLEPQDAADAVSETFLRALQNRAKYDDALGTPTSWLYGIAINVIRDQGRSRSRATSLRDRLGLERVALSERDVQDYVVLRESSQEVLEALADLPEAERELLL